MAKQLRVLVLVLVILGLFTGTASALQEKTNPVRVKVFMDTDIPSYYETKAATVGDFLKEIDIFIGENDICTPSLDTPIEAGLRIDIAKAFTVYLRVSGAGDENLIPVITTQTTLSQFLLKYSKATGNVYSYNNDDWALILKPDMIIDVSSAVVKESIVENIPFETEYIEAPELMEGEQQILVNGAAGKRLVTYNVTYEGTLEKTREKVETTVLTEPVKCVIKVGTKLPDNVKIIDGERIEFAKEITMNSTAYTADYASTGKRPGDKGFGICATGMTAQVGVVAVDPNYIPMYTKLYIEGYGYAVAGDTGGAIKGNKIDLFVDTSAEANNYGRKNVVVYILEDQEKEYIALK